MKYETPYDDFHGRDYLLHNKSRFEHLDSLNLSLANKSILEVGAGIGDHTEFLLEHNPRKILSLEARKDNIAILESRFNNNPAVTSRLFDMDNPEALNEMFDVCYCYGLLYHLASPEQAIEFMAAHTNELLLLETCVDYSEENSINLVNEDTSLYSQSFSGSGCRPGRVWLFDKLNEYFEDVYMPVTQPNHTQFPIDWKSDIKPSGLSRAVFIASRSPIDNTMLVQDVPYKQTRVSSY